MKKFLSLFLSVVILCSFCGCSVPKIFKDSKDFIGNLIGFDNTEVTTVEPEEVKEGASPLYYYQLTSNQQEIYRIMLSAANNYVTGWINLGEATENFDEDITVAFNALSDDHPELFWLPTTYLISKQTSLFETNALVAFEHSDGENQCSYIVSPSDIPDFKGRLEEKVNEIILKSEEYTNLFKKEVFIHDTLCERVVYTKNEESLTYTAYGALVNGDAVCEGYARALQLLYSKINIPNVLIHGNAEGERHIWNLVKLNENWYHLDATWNDDEEIISHQYFNVDDSTILKDHNISKVYTYGEDTAKNSEVNFNFFDVECNSNEFNYFVVYDLILEEDYEKALTGIRNRALLGQKHIEFIIKDDDFLNRFSNDYQTYCSKLQKKIKSRGISGVTLSTVLIKNNTVLLTWE